MAIFGLSGFKKNDSVVYALSIEWEWSITTYEQLLEERVSKTDNNCSSNRRILWMS